jgi:hypothetical protein
VYLDERGLAMDPETMWLRHEPCHGDPHPVVPATVKALRPTRDVLIEACSDWGRVAAKVDYVRLLRWDDGMVDRSSLAKAKRYVKPTIEELLAERRYKY